MLRNKNIVLGVTGSIAAYKAADIASKLTQAGAKVYTIMTPSAQQFISPITFRSLTGQPVVTEMFDRASQFAIEHVSLAQVANAVLVAPATADIMARIVAGIADDMVCLTVLATRAPVVLAPAMDNDMWQSPVTQDNLARLRARGITIVGPGQGYLASGKEGWGRLEDTEKIIGTLRLVLSKGGSLAGKKIVVSAGGTQEPLDPVRHLGNRSSGKMGYALAEAARDRGAQVVLISGPTTLPQPVGVQFVAVRTAQEMKQAVDKALVGANALLMAAAVADYRPTAVSASKIKKTEGRLTIEMERTPDILAEARGDFIRVGFAAESDDLEANATQKLRAKNLDLIVANDINAPDSGFEVDTNRVVLIDRQGGVKHLPLLPKSEAAEKIMDRVAQLLKEKA